MYRDGEKYMPSNGTEGMSFEEDHCMQCINCDPNPSGKKQCKIWFSAINSWPQGIPQWVYRDGKPTCTNFVKWDWGNDGDPDDPDNPKAPPPPPDPNQLNLFPLYPNELNYDRSIQMPAPQRNQVHGRA
jgi:hypothetical protein